MQKVHNNTGRSSAGQATIMEVSSSAKQNHVHVIMPLDRIVALTDKESQSTVSTSGGSSRHETKDLFPQISEVLGVLPVLVEDYIWKARPTVASVASRGLTPPPPTTTHHHLPPPTTTTYNHHLPPPTTNDKYDIKAEWLIN